MNDKINNIFSTINNVVYNNAFVSMVKFRKQQIDSGEIKEDDLITISFKLINSNVVDFSKVDFNNIDLNKFFVGSGADIKSRFKNIDVDSFYEKYLNEKNKFLEKLNELGLDDVVELEKLLSNYITVLGLKRNDIYFELSKFTDDLDRFRDLEKDLVVFDSYINEFSEMLLDVYFKKVEFTSTDSNDLKFNK